MSGPSAAQLELQYTQRILACLVYEIQVNWIEKDFEHGDSPDAGVVLEHLETLIKHAPPAVMPLVEYLRHNLPQERPGELYPFSFPFVEWRCE